MLVVEEKVTKQFFHTWTKKRKYQFIKEKKPKNACQRSEEKHHGVKEIFDPKKNKKNVHQRCTEKQEEHIARNHWKTIGTSRVHDKVSKSTKNTKSAQCVNNNA